MSKKNNFTFEITIKGSITLDETTQETTTSLVVFRGGLQLFERHDTMGSPVKLFQDEQLLHDWFKTARWNFINHLPTVLAHETAMSFSDQANAALNTLKIELLDMKDIVDDHLRNTADRIKDTLGMQRRGQQTAWTKLRLKRAIRREVASLPKQDRTLEKVAERLLTAYPEAAPASSDSLRKLITRFDLDWRELRTGQ